MPNPISLLATAALVAFLAKNAVGARPDEPASPSANATATCEAESAAVRTAKEFLRAHSRPGEFVETSARAENIGTDWRVTFSKVRRMMPRHCLIEIRKSDC